MSFKKNFVKVSIFSVILVLLGALFCYSKSLNLPEPTKAFYISDLANVLSDETKEYVLNQSNALNEKTSAQIVVATVNSLEGASIDEYGIALARKWEIGGGKEKSNGLLILLAPNERQIRIEVGDGLEGKINDSKSGRLIDKYAVPHFKSNDWDNGIHDLYTVILSEVYGEYGMEAPETVKDIATKVKDSGQNTVDDMVTIFISIAVIITSVVISFFVRRNPRWRRRRGNYDYHDDDFHGGFGGFGGFGGGSSSGGGFSGGGGNFSGGGASRGF